MEKLMNKMDVMEMDKVSGGSIKLRPRPGCHDSNANSMAANIMGGTENANSMAANVDETQNASDCVGKVFLPWQRPN